MIRAVIQDGRIQPLEQLPPDWREGQELLIEELQPCGEIRESRGWAQEVQEAMANVAPEDHQRLLAAVAEHRRHVCLHCFHQPSYYYLYPFRLADLLPEIAVPLLPGDPVLTVALQPIFDRAWDAGGFARYVRYSSEAPEPPLSAEQMAWAQGLLNS